jgi:hypothetical protein
MRANLLRLIVLRRIVTSATAQKVDNTDKNPSSQGLIWAGMPNQLLVINQKMVLYYGL